MAKPIQKQIDIGTLVRDYPDLFSVGAQMMFESTSKSLLDGLKDQSRNFKSLNAAIEKVAKGAYSASDRKGSLAAGRNLKTLEKSVQSTELSPEEKEISARMIDELKEFNAMQLKKDHSLRAAFSSSLKDNLPSLAGILGTFGLDNPAFIFLGSLIQGVVDHRRASAEAQAELLKDHHKELLAQDIEKQHSEQMQANLLEQANIALSALVHAGKAKEFADIEESRERIRREEALIDAVESVGNKLDDIVPAEEEKKGFFDKLLGMSDVFENFLLGMAAAKVLFEGVGTKVMKAGKALFKIAKRFAGPIGLVFTAVEFFRGASKGWADAAKKLNKESATTADKFASAIGGGLGSVVSIADSLLGLFGFETDIAGFVDQKVTEILAYGFNIIERAKDRIFNFFSNILDITFPEGFSITEMLKAPYRLVWNWWDALLDFNSIGQALGFEGNIKTFVENKTNEALDYISSMVSKGTNAFKKVVSKLATASLDYVSGLINDSVKIVKSFFSKVLTLQMPKDFNPQDIVVKGLTKLSDLVTDFFSKILEAFKNFNVTEMIKKSLDKFSSFSFFDSKEKDKSPSFFKANDNEDNPFNLEKEKAIDRNWYGNSTIEDWDRINELKPEDIQKIIDLNDFDVETSKRLMDIKRDKESGIDLKDFDLNANKRLMDIKRDKESGIDLKDFDLNANKRLKDMERDKEPDIDVQGNAYRKQFREYNTQMLEQTAVDKEKATSSTSASVVNAPSNSRKVTNNNVQNVSHSSPSPHDIDRTFQMMHTMIGH